MPGPRENGSDPGYGQKHKPFGAHLQSGPHREDTTFRVTLRMAWNMRAASTDDGLDFLYRYFYFVGR